MRDILSALICDLRRLLVHDNAMTACLSSDLSTSYRIQNVQFITVLAAAVRSQKTMMQPLIMSI